MWSRARHLIRATPLSTNGPTQGCGDGRRDAVGAGRVGVSIRLFDGRRRTAWPPRRGRTATRPGPGRTPKTGAGDGEQRHVPRTRQPGTVRVVLITLIGRGGDGNVGGWAPARAGLPRPGKSEPAQRRGMSRHLFFFFCESFFCRFLRFVL